MNPWTDLYASSGATIRFRRRHPADRLPPKPGVFAFFNVWLGDNAVLYIGTCSDLRTLEPANIDSIPEYGEACEFGSPAVAYFLCPSADETALVQIADSICDVYDPPLNRVDEL